MDKQCKNCRRYYFFYSVLSDHRTVSANINLICDVQKRQSGNLFYIYTTSVLSRFAEICTGDADPHRKYFIRTCVEESTLSSRRQKKSKHHASVSIRSYNSVVVINVKNYNHKSTINAQSPTTISKRNVANSRDGLQAAYDFSQHWLNS